MEMVDGVVGLALVGMRAISNPVAPPVGGGSHTWVVSDPVAPIALLQAPAPDQCLPPRHASSLSLHCPLWCHTLSHVQEDS